MGTDSKDLFIRMTHYLSSDLILGLQYDKQTSDLSSSTNPTLAYYQADVMFFTRSNWQIQAGYRLENANGSSPTDNPVPIRFTDNDIAFVQITYDF